MEQGEKLHRTLAQWLGEINKLDDKQFLPHDISDLYARVRTAAIETRKTSGKWPHRFSTLADQTVWAALHLLYPALSRSNAVYAMLDKPGTPEDPPEPLRYLHGEISALLASEKNTTS